jgi:MOSC domain-containing protein YiiM
MNITIDAILTGKIVQLNDEGALSAIGKSQVEGPRNVHFLGIEGDAQADLTVHGGPDKAIHHYPRDHYAAWQTTLGQHEHLNQAGAFGENVSTTGLVESQACIGDRYRLGTALVEISQGRQPCWKQGHRLGSAKVVAHMVKTQMCGWYYRVIEQGLVQAGDDLTLINRPFPDWSLKRVIKLLIAGEGKNDPQAIHYLANMRVLAQNWRKKAQSFDRM